jgi:predicted nucleotidyltransferase component of viral defense system
MIAIQKQTVSNALWDSLETLMDLEIFSSFRLVGGTALSLRLGHRISEDIDLFTDSDYGSIDFNQIDEVLAAHFPILQMSYSGNQSFGKSYFIGQSKSSLVKLDVFYTDAFVFPEQEVAKIRMAALEEIAAMKLDVIPRGGRKKDFWDFHELMEHFPITEMLHFYENRYPFGSKRDDLILKIYSFENANSDFDPICLRNKYWQIIKIDIEDKLQSELLK